MLTILPNYFYMTRIRHMQTSSIDMWTQRFDRFKEQVKSKSLELNDKVHDFSPLVIRKFAGPDEIARHLSKPFRVAHLTDQHVGKITPMWVQLDSVRQTNAQKPDVVLLTGDFVCHSELYLSDLSYIISQFDAPVFAVLGNHDHWTNAAAVRKALIAGGAEVLDNANTIISINNQDIQLVGLDDAYTHHANVGLATSGMKHNVPTIGLSHIAEEADALWSAGVPLVLSGHTHGGQVTIAGLHEIIIKRITKRKYMHGVYGKMGGSNDYGSVYVGAGIGSAVVPVRLGEFGRREVAIFDFDPAVATEF